MRHRNGVVGRGVYFRQGLGSIALLVLEERQDVWKSRPEVYVRDGLSSRVSSLKVTEQERRNSWKREKIQGTRMRPPTPAPFLPNAFAAHSGASSL